MAVVKAYFVETVNVSGVDMCTGNSQWESCETILIYIKRT